MALVLADRVQETTTTTGTGSVTLAGAVAGYQTFAVVGNGNTCYYTIVDGSAWEVGVGTYSTTGPTLARTTVLSNSNGDTSPITLAVGTKSVFVTYPAGKSINLNESGNASPLGTVSSGTWQGTTVGVAYGGTGVTASSGANSVVLRDANQNIAINRLNQGLLTTTASGGTTVLTVASAFNQALVGTGGQTYQLPDATTLSNTTAFQFNNNATGTLTIVNNASTTVGTIATGGAAGIALLSNATSGGTWDVHAYIPENVTWGTNALALGSTVITGGTWNGGTIASGYGGTGLTTFTGANNALYSTSSSALTAGTLPIVAGGTGATTRQDAMDALAGSVTSGSYLRGNGTDVVMSTIQAADVPTLNQNTTGNAATATSATTATNLAGGSAGTIPYQSAAGTTVQLAAGSSGQVLQSNGAAAPSWVAATAAANNGTLTMAVSGTGLSGSQTFTANQATNATFTVTSNATNANTASTIVARDASGNFSAGTITATLSGNASTATSATTAGTITSQANSATITAATANTASTIVLRDASGNFSAGTITATLSGNASTATSATSATSATTATTATTANALNTGNNYQVNSLGIGTAASGTAGEIRATNNITAYYSDERLKTKVGDITNALDKVRQITTMIYHANETAVGFGYDASIIEVGVTAQSVQAVQPEVVAPAPIDDRYLTVRYERLVPLIIEAIKELELQVQELRKNV